MNLLIDENLPLQLATGCGTGKVAHVNQLGQQLSDAAVWGIARAEGWVIVTKDVDFFDRCVLSEDRPKVIWIRVGNLRRREMTALFFRSWPVIESLLAEADLVEVFEDRIEGVSF